MERSPGWLGQATHSRSPRQCTRRRRRIPHRKLQAHAAPQPKPSTEDPHLPETPTIARSNLGKGLRALGEAVRHPGRSLRALTRGLVEFHRSHAMRRSPIPTAPLGALVPGGTTVCLADCEARDGNVNLAELVAIGSLVRARKPRVLLEIGTFDGNTTLQMAVNSPDRARVHTLDLPPGAEPGGEVHHHDGSYIEDWDKLDRRYLHHPAGSKVLQWLGDSATFDFTKGIDKGGVELAFIDGSHSYQYVKNDTEKVRAVLASGGGVLWHDYRPVWHGVMQYLDELARELPLVRIEGTSLVYWDGSRRTA